MPEWVVCILMLATYVQGFVMAAVIWAPDTPFWRGFRDGISLNPLLRLLFPSREK